MLQNIGLPGLMLILVVVLVLFGPSKLPELGRAVGRTLHEFKNSARELVGEGKKRLSIWKLRKNVQIRSTYKHAMLNRSCLFSRKGKWQDLFFVRAST